MLRQNGVSFLVLGRLYGVDHTTIIHQCKKYGVVPLSNEERRPISEIVQEHDKLQAAMSYSPQLAKELEQSTKLAKQDLSERICSGKMYSEYIAEEKERIERLRRTKRLLNNNQQYYAETDDCDTSTEPIPDSKTNYQILD